MAPLRKSARKAGLMQRATAASTESPPTWLNQVGLQLQDQTRQHGILAAALQRVMEELLPAANVRNIAIGRADVEIVTQDNSTPTTSAQSTSSGNAEASANSPSTSSGNEGILSDLQMCTWLRGVMGRALPAPEKPTFSGLSEETAPLFLRDLQKFGKVFNLSDKALLELAQECLKGDAETWATLYEDSWRTFSDFRKSFLDSFWTENKQREIRCKIGSGSYRKESGVSMLVHFGKYIALAKQLTTPIAEPLLVAEMMRHFPSYIQSLWRFKGVNTIAAAVELLTTQDIPGQNPPESAAGRRSTNGSRDSAKCQPTQTTPDVVASLVRGHRGPTRPRPYQRAYRRQVVNTPRIPTAAANDRTSGDDMLGAQEQRLLAA